MTQRFLIDGYNLLHAVGIPERLGQGGLERARKQLLSLVRHRFPDAECTVVFDGTQASTGSHRGVSVLFSKGEADDLIRDILAHDSAPKSLCVVSSDHAVQTAAKGRHAKFMDAEPFLRLLETRPSPPPAATPEKPSSEGDAKHWLEVFGAIDDDPAFRRMQEVEPLGRRAMKKKKRREGDSTL